MKHLFSAFVYSSYFLCCLSAEEISKNVIFDVNNKKVTTIEYQNEKDGLIEAEFYGDDPLYTDKKYFYDKTNPHYFERREYHDYHYITSDKDSGIARLAVFYMQKGNPLDEDRVEITFNGFTVEYTYYYIDNNKENLLNQIEETTIDEKTLRKEKIYADETKANDHIKDFSWFYDKDGNVIKTISHYFMNQEGIIDQVFEYDPPLFSEKDGNCIRATTTLKDNPNGYLTEYRVYDGKGIEIRTLIVDPKKNETGYTKIIAFYTNNKLIRQIKYFDNTLYKNKIYFISWYYNDDGSVKSTQFFDKNEKEIK